MATSLLLVSCPEPALTYNFVWQMQMPGMIEPGMHQMVGWKLEEIPRNATLYFDINGDGQADVVFAHPIIAQNNAAKCRSSNDNRFNDDYIVLSTCPSEKPFDYFVARQFTMFKLLNENRWSRIFMMVDKKNARFAQGND